MRRWAPVTAALTGLAACSLALAACGGASGAGIASDPAGGSVTLYNGQHEQTTNALVAGFEKATGISVAVRSDDEDALASQIVTAGGHSPADVIYTENSPALEYLQGKGMLAAVQPSTLAATPARYNSPQGDWVGVSARVSVLVYNPALISASQLPRTVLALASPKYRGKLAIAPQETDFQPIVTSVERAYGKAAALRWLEGLKANAAGRVYPDNETITDKVNRGSAALGVINQYYWYRLRAEIGAASTHAQIAFFTPGDPGYVMDVSGAAVLKSSAHAAAAQKFLAYLVSRQGQEVIAHSDSFEYPIASGVTTPQPEKPLAHLRPDPVTLGELGTGAGAVALMREAGLL